MIRFFGLGAVVFAAAVTAACGSDYQPAPAAPSPAPAGDLTIDIAEIRGPNSFYPSPISNDAGRVVHWYNSDSTTHHVVFDEAAIDTGTLAPGTTSQPFTIQPGT